MGVGVEDAVKDLEPEERDKQLNKVCIRAHVLNGVEWDKIKVEDCVAGDRGLEYTVD